ncbi:MAG: nuclear transport factor 2 family protein [Xanthomonadales bacterium]|nr:hypothetical protein [Xanthomonadales bacterium]MCC6593270.1 nuclear transport factor 2 family protein [Xanthomonadales bacterium]MCE7930921.1 nuclear transport factor 2 family protein [Xanthomonadales bacterium PRO6]
MSALARVHAIYAAFGSGNIPAILDRLSPDVDWEYGATPGNVVPWLQPRRGRDGAATFFSELARSLRIQRFAPKHFLADGDDLVVVVLDIEFVVLATGRRVVEEDEVHLWRFGADGLVCRFRHRADTALQAEACVT